MSKKNYVACDGDKCRICDRDIAEEGLRCSDCDGLSHLGCTGLPSYTLVYLALTRSAHVCSSCVLKKGNKLLTYEEAYKKIERLRDSEVETTEKIAACSGSGVAASPGPGQNTDQEAPGMDGAQGSQLLADCADAEPETKTQKLSVRKDGSVSSICKHYLQKKCKHGRKGEKCKFEHPKLCRRYLKFGRRAGSGCQKGSGCDYHHPRLCWEYSKTGWCSRSECRFYHSRGEASRAMVSIGGAGPSGATLVDQKNPGPVRGNGPAGAMLGARRRENRSSAAAATPEMESKAAIEGKNSDANFLLLLSQLQAQFHQMQSVVQALLTREAETVRVRPPGSAWPREHVFSLPT